MQNFRIRQRTRWDDEQRMEVVVGYRVTNDVIAKVREHGQHAGGLDERLRAKPAPSCLASYRSLPEAFLLKT
jgi:hypothetical protein